MASCKASLVSVQLLARLGGAYATAATRNSRPKSFLHSLKFKFLGLV